MIDLQARALPIRRAPYIRIAGYGGGGGAPARGALSPSRLSGFSDDVYKRPDRASG